MVQENQSRFGYYRKFTFLLLRQHCTEVSEMEAESNALWL